MKRSAFLLLLAAAAAFPQAATEANRPYRTRESRDKAARNISGRGRDARQKPRELMEAVRIAPGSVVVDLGSGAGYLLPWLSEAVGPSGKVIAQDIFPDLIEQARAAAEAKKLDNVSFVTGSEKDPNLPEGAADIIFVLDAYHHFDYPKEMLAAIRRGLKPGGRFIIVEYYKEGFRDPKHVRFTEKELVEEVVAAGYKLVSQKPFIEGVQYIAEFALP